jgi:hypothetical protein
MGSPWTLMTCGTARCRAGTSCCRLDQTPTPLVWILLGVGQRLSCPTSTGMWVPGHSASDGVTMLRRHVHPYGLKMWCHQGTLEQHPERVPQHTDALLSSAAIENEQLLHCRLPVLRFFSLCTCLLLIFVSCPLSCTA